MPDTLSKFLSAYCLRHKRMLAGLTLLITLWAATVSLTPYTLKLLIDSLNTENVRSENMIQNTQISAFLFVLLIIVTNAILRLYDWIMLQLFPQLKNEIISDLFSYLSMHPYSFFHQNFAGSLANKIHDLAKGTISIIHLFIDQFAARMLAVTIGAISMYFVHPYFSLGFVVWFAIFVITTMILSKNAQEYSADFSAKRSQVLGKIVDSLSNIFNIKIFARERHESLYLKRYTNELLSKERNINLFIMKSKITYNASIILLVIYEVFFIINEKSLNNISIGDTAFILTLTLALTRDILLIINQLTTISEEIGICRHALNTLQPQYPFIHHQTASPQLISKGKIVFKNVHFSYENRSSLFKDLSVTIEGGTKIGLVGLSGSGKTSFAHLILRLYSPSLGDIYIDNQNIKDFPEESLREQIAFIPQDPYLFNRSIMDNIRYGRLDATNEEVIECAKKAHCHEFIHRLEHGYQSMVGEKGSMLSGGQRQRIAIARAIIKNAPILILDEATSALDSITENVIQNNLFHFMRNKTTIIIAHRLSTILQMDRIIVFQEGQIVGDDTHRELIHSNRQYNQIWNTQTNHELNTKQILKI